MMAMAGETVLRPGRTRGRASTGVESSGRSPNPDTSTRRPVVGLGSAVRARSSAASAAERISNAATGGADTYFRRVAGSWSGKTADRGKTDIGAEVIEMSEDHLSDH